MNKYAFQAIMASDDTVTSDLSIMGELLTLSDFKIHFSLEMNESQDGYQYVADANNIIESDLPLDALLELKSCGWVYDESKNLLIRKI